MPPPPHRQVKRPMHKLGLEAVAHLVTVHNVHLFTDQNVPEQREEHREGRKARVLDKGSHRDVVNLEAVCHVSHARPSVVMVRDHNHLGRGTRNASHVQDINPQGETAGLLHPKPRCWTQIKRNTLPSRNRVGVGVRVRRTQGTGGKFRPCNLDEASTAKEPTHAARHLRREGRRSRTPWLHNTATAWQWTKPIRETALSCPGCCLRPCWAMTSMGRAA